MLQNIKELNNGPAIVEICGNCFYYKHEPRENIEGCRTEAREKIVRFVKCESCATKLATSEAF